MDELGDTTLAVGVPLPRYKTNAERYLRFSPFFFVKAKILFRFLLKLSTDVGLS